MWELHSTLNLAQTWALSLVPWGNITWNVLSDTCLCLFGGFGPHPIIYANIGRGSGPQDIPVSPKGDGNETHPWMVNHIYATISMQLSTNKNTRHQGSGDLFSEQQCSVHIVTHHCWEMFTQSMTPLGEDNQKLPIWNLLSSAPGTTSLGWFWCLSCVVIGHNFEYSWPMDNMSVRGASPCAVGENLHINFDSPKPNYW